MSSFDDPVMREIEQAVKAHKQKIDRTIERDILKGLASGEITVAQFEKAPNGDSWFRLVDQEGVPIVYNWTKRTVYSYGGGINEDDPTSSTKPD
jgi:hypothetical protein